mgnify:CR=1 FL=1
MRLLTRKNGIILTIIGVIIFLFNYFTLKWWDVDIDILGAIIFVLGIVLMVVARKNMKHSSKWLTRENGIWLCIIGVAIALITGYLPFIDSDIGGIFGMGVFVLGLILIVVRWNY